MPIRWLLTLLLLAIASIGWAEAGHKIVASIAYRQLSPDQQAKFVAVLKQHPRFAEDFEAHRPSDVDAESDGEWIFQQAAIWPDLVKGLKGEPKQLYNHPVWHYVDVPYFRAYTDQKELGPRIKEPLLNAPPEPHEQMNVVQAIRFARRVVADDSTDPATRAVYLCWLLHLVGDIHQPLHAAEFYSVDLFPKGDKGGNEIKTHQHGNLHAVWDNFPGNHVKFHAAVERALKLDRSPELGPWGAGAARNLDERRWMIESHQLAVDVAYAPEVLSFLRTLLASPEERESARLTLSEEYLRAGGQVAQKQLVIAGHRLGAVLRQAAE